MQKIREILKPFSSIIFGTLLFLSFLNYLSLTGATLAIGIIALIISIYYIAYGVIEIICKDQIPTTVNKIFDVCSITLFPLLMFFIILMDIISLADTMLPTAWIISIFSIIVTLIMIFIYIVAFYLKNKCLDKLNILFSSLFILVLLLDLLFDPLGDPINLGNISIVGFIIYFSYSSVLLESIIEYNKKESENLQIEQITTEENKIDENNSNENNIADTEEEKPIE